MCVPPCKKHGAGVVVHDDRGLSPGHLAEKRLGVRGSVATPSRQQVILQCRVSPAHGVDRLSCRERERRTPKIRVYDHARGVDDRPQAVGQPHRQTVDCHLYQLITARNTVSRADGVAASIQRGSEGVDRCRVAV